MNSAHRLIRRLRAAIADQAGVAAVEFALILPLMLVMLFAFFEAGRMYWTYNIVSASARDAARYAAHLPVDCGTDAFKNASDKAAVENLARTGKVTGGTPLVSGWTDSVAASVICQPIGTYDGRYTGMAEIPTVRVVATAPFQTLFATLLPGLDVTTITVTHNQVWTE